MRNRKVVLSFLGVTNYVPATYALDQKKSSVPQRFIQESILELLCKDWTEKDKFFVFCTVDAYKRNWLDDGHKTFDTKEIIKQQGLASCLDNKKKEGYAVSVEPVKTVEGFTTAQVWEIFKHVIEVLEEGDEVIFDITHSFRSIPMLGLILLNYASAFHNIKVVDVLYGAYEVLRENPEGNAPIVSMKELIHLQEWTKAINEFDKFGSATSIQQIGEQNEDENVIQLSKQLKKIHEQFTTVRGSEILEGKEYTKALDLTSKLKQENQIPVINEVIHILETKIQNLSEKGGLINGLAGVQYCIDHQLVQQGITLLQEVLKEFVLIKLEKDPKNRKNRDTASSALSYYASDQEEWDKSTVDVALFDAVVEEGFAMLATYYKQLSQFRNDINHGGFGGKNKSDAFEKALNELYGKVMKQI